LNLVSFFLVPDLSQALARQRSGSSRLNLHLNP